MEGRENEMTTSSQMPIPLRLFTEGKKFKNPGTIRTRPRVLTKNQAFLSPNAETSRTPLPASLEAPGGRTRSALAPGAPIRGCDREHPQSQAPAHFGMLSRRPLALRWPLRDRAAGNDAHSQRRHRGIARSQTRLQKSSRSSNQGAQRRCDGVSGSVAEWGRGFPFPSPTGRRSATGPYEVQSTCVYFYRDSRFSWKRVIHSLDKCLTVTHSVPG